MNQEESNIYCRQLNKSISKIYFDNNPFTNIILRIDPLITNNIPDEKLDDKTESDIKLILSQVTCSREIALKALRNNNNDIVEAILSIY